MFLISNIVFASSAFALYWGDPWKLKFYEHIPLIVLFVVDMIVGIVFFFVTPQIASAFGFTGIDTATGGVLLGITLAAVFLQWIYNPIIRRFELYKTKL